MAANYPAVYLQRRRRGRRTPAFESPPDIAGLKLWLDASAGARHAWNDVPASGSASLDYSPPASDYAALGHTHWLRVYPFKTVGGVQVFSAACREIEVTDDSSMLFYFINWAWDAVPGAEGYRLLRSDPVNGWNYDGYVDVFAPGYQDTGSGGFSAGDTVTPHTLSDAQDGESVDLWLDQSGLGHDATAVSSVTSATLMENILNGEPVLRFGSAAGYSTPLVLNTPCTVFAVYALNGLDDLARRAVQGSNNWLIGPYGPPHEFYNGGGFADGPLLTRGVFVTQAAWQNGSVSRNWVNGAFVGNVLGAGTGPGTVGLGTGGTFNEPLDGDLAEVIAYDSALSEANLANVWNYLAAKYALT